MASEEAPHEAAPVSEPGSPVAMGSAGSSAGGSASSHAQHAKELRVDAPAFVPQERIRPVRTRHERRSVYETLDAVPFTPSQGICTPTPTNMASSAWCSPHHLPPYALDAHLQVWSPMSAKKLRPRGSPAGASVSSFSTMSGTMEQVPGTPGTPGHAPLMFSSFYFPMPVSPSALHMAAYVQPGTPGAPISPVYFAAPQHLGHHPHHHMHAAMGMPGSPLAHGRPAHLGEHHAPFAHYWAAQPTAHHSDMSGAGLGSSQGDSESSQDGDNVSEAGPSADLAAALHTASSMHGPPPPELVDLAALMHAYGLMQSAVPAPPQSSAPTAGPAARAAATGPAAAAAAAAREQRPRRQRVTPRLGPDGQPVLNARQRRTLRRAQERAVRAISNANKLMDADDAHEAELGFPEQQREQHHRSGSSDDAPPGTQQAAAAAGEGSPDELVIAPGTSAAQLACHMLNFIAPLTTATNTTPLASKPISRFGREASTSQHPAGASQSSGPGVRPPPPPPPQPGMVSNLAHSFRQMAVHGGPGGARHQDAHGRLPMPMPMGPGHHPQAGGEWQPGGTSSSHQQAKPAGALAGPISIAVEAGNAFYGHGGGVGAIHV